MPVTLNLDFSTGALDSAITFTRASSGSYFNSFGTLSTATTDAARFDYDPVTRAFRGLLIEEARTNYVLRSAELDNAAWDIKVASTIAANAITAPDGTVTADKLVEDTSNSIHAVGQQINGLTPLATYAYTAFFKAAERTIVEMRVFNNFGSASANYDLSVGTVYGGGVGGNMIYVSSSISPVSNGWYRCSLVFTDTNNDTLFVPRAYLQSGGTNTYQGDGYSGLYMWGAQLEIGSLGTSYIATTSAAVLRAADVATITGSNFSGFYSQTTGTIYANGEISVQGTNPLVSINNNTANERIDLRAAQADANIHLNVVDGGVTQADISVSRSALTAILAAGAYAANDFMASYNGTNGTADTSGTLPTPDRMMIGRDASSNYLNGWLKRVVYWNARSSNSALVTLTATGIILPEVLTASDTPTQSIADVSTLVPYLLLQADGDLSAGSWTTELGATSNLYQSIDERTADDSDFVQSDSFPVASVVSFSLSDPALPVGAGTGRVRVRYYKQSVEVVNLIVRLKQGVTTIKTWTYTDIDFDVLEVDETLTAPEVATITDDTALTLEYEASWTP